MLLSDCEVVIPSCRLGSAQILRESLLPSISARILNGVGYPSFSKLINDAITTSPAEVVVIVNDKARPLASDIQILIDRLDQGYGMADLYLFGCFAIQKEVLRRIGVFDEMFIGGHHSDCDWLLRMNEADIAFYHEIGGCQYDEGIGSAWVNPPENFQYYKNKWGQPARPEDPEIFKRRFWEQPHFYDLGKPRPEMKFLPHSKSVMPASGNYFLRVKVIFSES